MDSMTTVRYPSEQFPAQPTLSLDLPAKWTPLEGAGIPLAATREVKAGEFRPNVVVLITRFAAQYTLTAAIAEVTAKLEASPGYEELGRADMDVSGYPGFRVEGAFSDARVGSLMQGVRIAWIDRGPVVDLVQITVSATGSQAEEIWGELRQIQDSLRIEI